MTTTGSIREVAEGRQFQGADEKITWTVTTTNWASTPTNVVQKVKQMPSGVDVTSSVVSGSTSVSGDIITLQPIDALTPGTLYRVEVQFTAGGGAPFECFFELECQL